MSLDPVGYAFSGGYVLCADCCTDETDEGNSTGQAGAIFNWDEAALSDVCDTCEQVLIEASGYWVPDIDKETD